jgi:antitoxin (DNA-binding transcriptional repressor) of toxin-antitoxin stability system
MKTVGIKNLKNSLSRYVALVKAGERIFITEHDTIVAEIIPSAGEKSESDLLEEYLAAQAASGSLQRSTKKASLTKKRGKTKARKENLRKIYAETRSERL